MQSKLILSFLFACFGITLEIIFTAVKYNAFLPLIHGKPINWSLEGTSYLWMFFIYGAIPFIFPLVFNTLKKLHIIFRILIYGIIILAIEYITGAILDLVTGNCPWLYTEGITLNGYIRLDYLPIWIFFGFLVEKLWIRLNTYILLQKY